MFEVTVKNMKETQTQMNGWNSFCFSLGCTSEAYFCHNLHGEACLQVLTPCMVVTSTQKLIIENH